MVLPTSGPLHCRSRCAALGSLLKMHHLKVDEGIGSLPREKMALWERLEKSTTHPLHRSRASELFLEVLTLQDAGTEIDWPSIYCAITTLTRLDKACLQARLAVGCSESPCLQACIVVQASCNISSNAVDLPQVLQSHRRASYSSARMHSHVAANSPCQATSLHSVTSSFLSFLPSSVCSPAAC